MNSLGAPSYGQTLSDSFCSEQAQKHTRQLCPLSDPHGVRSLMSGLSGSSLGAQSAHGQAAEMLPTTSRCQEHRMQQQAHPLNGHGTLPQAATNCQQQALGPPPDAMMHKSAHFSQSGQEWTSSENIAGSGPPQTNTVMNSSVASAAPLQHVPSWTSYTVDLNRHNGAAQNSAGQYGPHGLLHHGPLESYTRHGSDVLMKDGVPSCDHHLPAFHVPGQANSYSRSGFQQSADLISESISAQMQQRAHSSEYVRMPEAPALFEVTNIHAACDNSEVHEMMPPPQRCTKPCNIQRNV